VEIDTMNNKLLALGVVYSDAVLLPILAGFLILTGYAIWRQKQQK